MDVPSLIREARDRRAWSQMQFAAVAGTSRAAVSAYESGRKSPTVATLNRILAAAGLQIRAELEPLLADLDARVDAVAGEAMPLDAGAVAAIAHAAQAFPSEQRYLIDNGAGEDPEVRTGPVTWAIDGETALRAHGLGFAAETLGLALLFDEPGRAFLFGARVRGTGGPPVSWFDSGLAEAQQHLGDLALGPFGMVRVRLVAEHLTTVRVEVAEGLVVPVLALEEVERARPDLAEVMARLREGGRGARSLGA